MKAKTLKEAKAEYGELEKRWLNADAAAHQAHQIVLSAQRLINCGMESEAFILIDAAVVVLDHYCMES